MSRFEDSSVAALWTGVCVSRRRTQRQQLLRRPLCERCGRASLDKVGVTAWYDS